MIITNVGSTHVGSTNASYMVLLYGAIIITWCYYVFRNQLFRKYLQTIFKLANLRNV